MCMFFSLSGRRGGVSTRTRSLCIVHVFFTFGTQGWGGAVEAEQSIGVICLAVGTFLHVFFRQYVRMIPQLLRPFCSSLCVRCNWVRFPEEEYERVDFGLHYGEGGGWGRMVGSVWWMVVVVRDKLSMKIMMLVVSRLLLFWLRKRCALKWRHR